MLGSVDIPGLAGPDFYLVSHADENDLFPDLDLFLPGIRQNETVLLVEIHRVRGSHEITDIVLGFLVIGIELCIDLIDSSLPGIPGPQLQPLGPAARGQYHGRELTLGQLPAQRRGKNHSVLAVKIEAMSSLEHSECVFNKSLDCRVSACRILKSQKKAPFPARALLPAWNQVPNSHGASTARPEP